MSGKLFSCPPYFFFFKRHDKTKRDSFNSLFFSFSTNPLKLLTKYHSRDEGSRLILAILVNISRAIIVSQEITWPTVNPMQVYKMKLSRVWPFLASVCWEIQRNTGSLRKSEQENDKQESLATLLSTPTN